MKLIAQVKLLPTPEQRHYLLQTLEQTNAACNVLSHYAWEQRMFGKFKLQQAMYETLRSQTGLTAQIVIRLIAKVADAYKKDKRTPRRFWEHGAIAYDDRILRWYTAKQAVSIWSVGGRLHIAYQGGEHQKRLLEHQKGESDLVYSKTSNEFYLLAVCDIPDPDQRQTDEALGIDMGVTNIAVSSDGDIFNSQPD